MAAMVVGPKCRRLLNRTISRSWIGSQTTTRRMRWGQSLTACAPVKRMSSSAKMLRGNGPMADSDLDDLPLVDWIPNHHAPHEMGTVLDRLCARKADEFIGQDVAGQRPHGGFDDLIGGVVLQACHEEHPAVGPLAEERVVVIAPVHGYDGTGIEIQRLRH